MAGLEDSFCCELRLETAGEDDDTAGVGFGKGFGGCEADACGAACNQDGLVAAIEGVLRSGEAGVRCFVVDSTWVWKGDERILHFSWALEGKGTLRKESLTGGCG